MHLKELHYRWEWQLKASPEMLWQFISDTNRFNHDAGIPSVEVLQGDLNSKPTDNARRDLRLHLMGVTVEWEEEPFEWVRPYRFGVIRRYKSGPMAEMRLLVEITPQPDGGSHLIYSVWAQPKTVFGVIAIPLQIGILSARNFSATIRRYDNMVTLKKLPFDLPVHTHFAPGGKARLEASRKSLIDQGIDRYLTDKFLETIEKADDITLSRIRPFALADYWQMPRKTVLDLCMIATRSGILDFRWEVLCPLCRGAKQSSDSLGGISSQVHCKTCNIDFSANFDQLVELTFRPNQAIRHIEIGEYCVGGPQVTPHIIAQQLLQPGTKRSLPIPLETGRYRMRTLKLPGGQGYSVSAEGVSEITICANPEGWSREEIQIAHKVSLHLQNETDTEQLFIFERMIWSDQAVTAAEVTAMQSFRDLFANEALRPGERISVGSMTILFTDLRGSTRLYREIGDASAFGRVMNHFDILREVVVKEGGALVKTIGDAIMAVFRRPAPALRAIMKAQHILRSPETGIKPLLLKAGIHYGPCIAVTLNDRLDYFGSTVNLAARLEGLSTGEDIVITTAVHTDPEVLEMITNPENGFNVHHFDATLKGFDEEQFELWRITQKTINNYD